MSEQTSHQITDAVPSLEQQVGSLWDLVEVLEARLSRLEAKRSVFFHPTTTPSAGLYYCRALDCNSNRKFKTQASLYEHLRSTIGPGHQALLAIINQTDYQICDRKFNKAQGVTSHETRIHSDSFGTKPANRHERHAPIFSSRHPTDLTSEDANDGSYSSEGWAAAFATLIDHQDVQAVQSLFHLYMNACGRDSANLSTVTTTTLTNPRKRADNDAQRYNLDFNTNPADESIDINATYSRKLDERVLTTPSLSMRSLDTMRQAADDDTISLTKTGRPSKPFGSNGGISRTEPEAPAHALETARLPKGGLAVNTSHPTPDPTASMDIAEVMRPEIGFRDINGTDNQAVPTPNFDPPEYAEEDYNEHQGAPPNEGNLQSQADYRLRFLSIFIDKFLEHPWNSGDEATEEIAFDAEAFWAADSCYQEYDEEDDNEDEDEYPIALASEEYFQTDKDRRISVLSDFVDSLYRVAKLGPRFPRLEEIVAIHESVTKELRGEAIVEGRVR